MRVKVRGLLAGFAALVFAVVPAGAQQTGTVTGVITNVAGEPLASVQVSIQGTGYGTLTQSNGRFAIVNVPSGRRTVRADLIGFASKTQVVDVPATGSVTADFSLSPQAVSLSAIVVTGVSGATSKTKLPFEVAQVRAEDMPVPTPSPASALQGKVAGVTVVQGDGRPGSGASILLRGPTSLNASGRSQDPLYIVDGVILSGDLVDLDALDIESIEVVKGAAGASLYGSRAGAGVVQIRTKRGTGQGNNTVRYTMRSEFGQSSLASVPDQLVAKQHRFLLSADGKFINSNGTTCEWLACTSPKLAGQTAKPGETVNEWNTYQSVAWPGPTYDQVDRFFSASTFLQNYASAEGRSGATNYHVSISNLKDPGVLPALKGFNRTNVRVNVDQNVLPSVQVQASAFYSRSTQGPNGALFDLTRMPAGVDLTAPDPKDSTSVVLNADFLASTRRLPTTRARTRSTRCTTANGKRTAVVS